MGDGSHCHKLFTILLFWSLVNSASASADRRRVDKHPLAEINIYNTTLALRDSVAIRASPFVLGSKGQDSEWVSIHLINPTPSANDWVAVFSPANFNSSTCPAVNNEDKEPYLCTSPIKFKYTNSSKSYSKTGKAVLKFQLINQRADFSFALFSGGLSNPKLVAISNSIIFANPKAPLYPRLAQGKYWNEMTVTRTSGYSAEEAVPLVEWGMKGESTQTRSPAGTLTIDRNSLCGSPARTVGWRDQGFIHTSFLMNLWPHSVYVFCCLLMTLKYIYCSVEGIPCRLWLWCFRYTYKMGHRLSNGSYIWSKAYSFRSSPYPGHDSLQRVLIFGDMGKAERDGSNDYINKQPGSLNTTDQLIKDLDNIDIVFHIGDLAYADGYLSQWDQFLSQVEPIASSIPYMVASGNHERTWPDSGGFYQAKDSGGECGVTAETLFYVPAENRAKFWYSTDYGMFRFCIADSEHDWREGSEQYKFLDRCLASVDRRKQPWLIFAAHRPLGYSSNDWYAQEGAYEEPMGRDDMQKLWQKYRVDIAFFGHVHNYERTCPIYQNICVKSGTSHYSGVVNGTIHIVAGGGGRKLADFASQIPNWSLVRDFDYGYTKLTAFNHSSLLFEYMKSSDGKVYDSFTISREYMDVLACVHDSCAPSTLAA